MPKLHDLLWLARSLSLLKRVTGVSENIGYSRTGGP